MTRSRILRAYACEAHYELRRVLRSPTFVVATLLLPLFLYLLIGVTLVGPGANPRIVTALFTGFAAFAMTGPGMFTFGAALAAERQQGLMTLKRALPMPPGAYVLAKILAAVVLAAAVMVEITVLAVTFAGVPLTLAQFLQVGMVNVLGSLPFTALGLHIGVRTPAAGAQAMVYLVYFPMMYLSGLFFPLPAGLQRMAVVWPTYHLNRLAQSAAGLPANGALTHALVLAAITGLFAGLAVRRLARAG